MNQPEVLRKFNGVQVVDAIRKEAQSNEVFASVCLVFAMRERTRQQITIPSLRLTMAREGFHYDQKQLEKVLTFLASVGIGRLDIDSSGKVKRLTDIKVTLQSIGKAGTGTVDKVDKFNQATRFTSLKPNVQLNDPSPGAPAPPKPAAPKEAAESTRYKVSLLADANGKAMSFPTPMYLTSDELVELISEMNKAGRKKIGGGH